MAMAIERGHRGVLKVKERSVAGDELLWSDVVCPTLE